ncbi:MAG: hypothetical protein FWE37_06825 [Spirochaetaceae bacterium]|nr:hypothetical protein [Spirochaetaceae bacterium]
MKAKNLLFLLIALVLQVTILLVLLTTFALLALPIFVRAPEHSYAVLTICLFVLVGGLYALIYHKFIKDIIYKESKNDSS